MAWIESHTNLERHPKLIKFQKAMKWSKNEAVGFLHRFWWFVLESYPSGDVSTLTEDQLQNGLQSRKNSCSTALVELLNAGFLERNGDRILVHDWLDYAGRFLKNGKYRRSPEKFKQIEDSHADRQTTVRRPSDDRQTTVPNLPNLPNLPEELPESARFIPPTLDQVCKFCRERKSNISPHKFFERYDKQGWKIGGHPFDWRLKIMKWEENQGYSNEGPKKEDSRWLPV